MKQYVYTGTGVFGPRVLVDFFILQYALLRALPVMDFFYDHFFLV